MAPDNIDDSDSDNSDNTARDNTVAPDSLHTPASRPDFDESNPDTDSVIALITYYIQDVTYDHYQRFLLGARRLAELARLALEEVEQIDRTLNNQNYDPEMYTQVLRERDSREFHEGAGGDFRLTRSADVMREARSNVATGRVYSLEYTSEAMWEAADALFERYIRPESLRGLLDDRERRTVDHERFPGLFPDLERVLRALFDLVVLIDVHLSRLSAEARRLQDAVRQRRHEQGADEQGVGYIWEVICAYRILQRGIPDHSRTLAHVISRETWEDSPDRENDLDPDFPVLGIDEDGDPPVIDLAIEASFNDRGGSRPATTARHFAPEQPEPSGAPAPAPARTGDDAHTEVMDYWPNIERWMQARAGPRPEVSCLFCTHELDIEGLEPVAGGGREPSRKLECGHMVGAICIEEYIRQEAWEYGNRKGTGPRCPSCQHPIWESEPTGA